jgi:hypothetical protein
VAASGPTGPAADGEEPRDLRGELVSQLCAPFAFQNAQGFYAGVHRENAAGVAKQRGVCEMEAKPLLAAGVQKGSTASIARARPDAAMHSLRM